MTHLIETLQAALTKDASEEARSAGVAACRTILAALEAKPGEPMIVPTAQDMPVPLAATVALLQARPVDELLDLLIAKLRAVVPDVPPVGARSLKIELIKVPVP
jgi:hypothetical protein